MNWQQFFFLVVYLVYFKVFFTILSQRIYRRRKKMVDELPQVTLDNEIMTNIYYSSEIVFTLTYNKIMLNTKTYI